MKVLGTILFLLMISVATGDEPKDRTKLNSTDGNSYSISDFSESKVLVLIFTRNTCPIAVDYENRLNKLSETYNKSELSLVAINVDNGQGESLEEMKKIVATHSLKYHYLHDPEKVLAKKLNATATPHAFVFNEKRDLIYSGLIDDSRDESLVDKDKGRYVELAILSVLKNTPCPKTTKPKGCSIRY